MINIYPHTQDISLVKMLLPTSGGGGGGGGGSAAVAGPAEGPSAVEPRRHRVQLGPAPTATDLR